MLVWNAMPSITPMMSTIFCELALISLIVCTTPRTTSPPRDARSAASRARPLARVALSALLATVDVNSSMLAAVCSSADDCCSVRDDRSVLPAAISFAPVVTASEPARTFATVSVSPCCIRDSARSNCPISLRPASGTLIVRSPSATRMIRSHAWCSGATTSLRSARCTTTISSTDATMPTHTRISTG
jgi:hypothetical protein